MVRLPSLASLNNASVVLPPGDNDGTSNGKMLVPPRFVSIHSKYNNQTHLIMLKNENTISLSTVQHFFPGTTRLSLKRGNAETAWEPIGDVFKGPLKGWDHFTVYAISKSNGTSVTEVESNFDGNSLSLPQSRNSSDIPLDEDNEDDGVSCPSSANTMQISVPSSSTSQLNSILVRFNVNSFDELRYSFRFSAAAICDMSEFINYRNGALQVFLQVILKLGPELFDLFTLFRVYVGDPDICDPLMFLVKGFEDCEVCDLEFDYASEALSHFASIEHARNCLANFKEPQLLEKILSNARDLGFFTNFSSLPRSDNPFNNVPVYKPTSFVFEHDDHSDESSVNDDDCIKSDDEIVYDDISPFSSVLPLPSNNTVSTLPEDKNVTQQPVQDFVSSLPSVINADAEPSTKSAIRPVNVKPNYRTLLDHFKVTDVYELFCLKMFKPTVSCGSKYFRNFDRFRDKFCKKLVFFLVSYPDPEVPVMFYLFEASKEKNSLHNIDASFPRYCGVPCKNKALTFGHMFGDRHFQSQSNTLTSELNCAIEFVKKKFER